MDPVVVIANPVASQFTGGAHRDVMAHLTKSHPVEAVWPSSAAEAAQAAGRAAADGASVVVAMGGDGMVHHVAQGLVGTDTALGIIPAGTTNVVARLLGVSSRPVRAARQISHSDGSRRVGVVELVLSSGTIETTHYAIFACGFGLDAEVVVKADGDPYRKYRFGSIHYATTALGVGLRGFPSRRPHVDVRAEGRESSVTTVLIQFRQIYTYFGLIPLRLAEEPPDPMTVLTLGRLHRRRIPRIAGSAMLGRDLSRLPEMEVWPGVESLELTARPPTYAQADGESLGLVDSARARWLPEGLKVVSA